MVSSFFNLDTLNDINLIPLIPRTTRYNKISDVSLQSNPKIRSMSFYCIPYLYNSATNLCTILFTFKNQCSAY